MGRTSVFYALDQHDGEVDSTELHIKLPHPSHECLRWMKRNFHGDVSTGAIRYDPDDGFHDILEEGTLLILKQEQKHRSVRSFR